MFLKFHGQRWVLQLVEYIYILGRMYIKIRLKIVLVLDQHDVSYNDAMQHFGYNI